MGEKNDDEKLAKAFGINPDMLPASHAERVKIYQLMRAMKPDANTRKPKWPWTAIGLAQDDYYRIKHPRPWPASWDEDGPDWGSIMEWCLDGLTELADAEKVYDAVSMDWGSGNFHLAHTDKTTALVNAVRTLHMLSSSPEAVESVLKDMPTIKIALAFCAINNELHRLMEKVRRGMQRGEGEIDSDDTMSAALEWLHKTADAKEKGK